jgi:hypothetical protein
VGFPNRADFDSTCWLAGPLEFSQRCIDLANDLRREAERRLVQKQECPPLSTDFISLFAALGIHP